MRYLVTGLLAALTLSLATAEAGTLAAANCSLGEVTNAVSAAQDGDIVDIPAGACTWTANLKISTGITLRGAGIGKTVITDEGPAATSTLTGLISLSTIAGKVYRITGMTFVGGSVDRGIAAVILVSGTSKAWRVDHVNFDRVRAQAIRTVRDTYGVVDHNQFLVRPGKFSFTLYHDAWGGAQYGDRSWSDASSLGTERAIFIEDNTFQSDTPGTNAILLDVLNGARYVFRHNQVTDGNLASHGTESSGRQRGLRQFEIYENVMHQTAAGGARAAFIRSGTGVIWGNTLTGVYTSMATFINYRSSDSFLFGRCDGTSVWDRNIAGVDGSGVHTGPLGTVLIDNTASWMANEWHDGYTIHNKTTGRASLIKANTSTSITPGASAFATPAAMSFNTGEAYEIRQAYPCLDQVGWVRGTLLSGNPALPQGWPNQTLEPVYEWNNTLNGYKAKMESLDTHIQANREFYNDTEKPGYTPFTYPHPLTQGLTQGSGGSGATGLPAPSNLTVK
jgi:hypothetical protein